MAAYSLPILAIRVAVCIFALSGLLAPGFAEADEATCGSLVVEDGTGPYDWRAPGPAGAKTWTIVERHHWGEHIVRLQDGRGSYIGAHLDFILRRFPNHYQALQLMLDLSIKKKSKRSQGMGWDAECYVERALRFQPDDDVVRMIYGMHLAKTKRYDQAVTQFQQAEKSLGNDANFNYNFGLIQFEIKNYETSMSYARKAYSAGFPLPGLRDKLKGAGKWMEN